MSQSQVASGDTSDARGAGQGTDTDNQGNNDSGTSGAEDQVAYSTYQKTLHQAKKARTENEELRQRLDSYEQEKLEAQKKYEDLYRKEREQREKTEGKYSELSKKIEDQTKRSAMQSHLAKLGIDPKYSDKALNLVDLSDLHIDDMNNEVVGAEAAAQRFREEYDVFFKARKPGVSHGAPDSAGVDKPVEQMTKEELYAHLRSTKGA